MLAWSPHFLTLSLSLQCPPSLTPLSLTQALPSLCPPPLFLLLQVCPQETTPSGLAGLTALGLLDGLEHLALYDAELPADSLAQHLAGAARLTSLQFGLSTVAPELSTLRALPKLQVGLGGGVSG